MAQKIQIRQPLLPRVQAYSSWGEFLLSLPTSFSPNTNMSIYVQCWPTLPLRNVLESVPYQSRQQGIYSPKSEYSDLVFFCIFDHSLELLALEELGKVFIFLWDLGIILVEMRCVFVQAAV